MPLLLSAHFSYKQQGVKAVCSAFTHRNNFYRDQAPHYNDVPDRMAW